MPDGSHKIFSEERVEKSDTKEDVYSYSTELILPEFEQGFIKIYAYDRYGFEFEKDLCVNEPGGMRLFTISHYDNYIYEDGRDPYLADNFKMGFGTVNLDGSDFYEEFFIEVSPVEDGFFDSFKEFITDPGTKVNRLTGVTLRGVSPDKKWVAICGFHSHHFKNKDFMHEGYDVQKVSSEDFLIINTSTKEIRKIGTRHEIHYSSGYLKEIGPAYCIVKWDEDDKLYLVEQTKENKFFNKSQIVNYPSINNQMQVPWALARGVLLSLEDFSLNETDEVNPVAPWISFYDQTTGVIAYSSIDYDFGKHMYPGSFEQSATFGEIEFSQQGMIVSDLKGEHVWDIPKILTKEETDKYKLTNCDIIGSGYINGKLYAFIYAMFGDVTIDYSGKYMRKYLMAGF
ncbi:MAG: hypothetical protein R2883_00480 [Caldisericia bacterium]